VPFELLSVAESTNCERVLKLQAGTIAGTEHSVQYIQLSHTARNVEVIFSFIISCYSLLFLLLFSHLSVCLCLSVPVHISIILLYFRLLPTFLLIHFKSHINFSPWWKMMIRPILAKFRVGSSLVCLIAVSIILKLVKKSTVTTTW